MKKFLFSILLTVLLLFCFTSCSDNNSNYEKYVPIQGSMFVCIERYEDPYLGSVKILVDKETRIMYMYANYKGVDQESACITVLYDSDGKPKKYNGVITD